MLHKTKTGPESGLLSDGARILLILLPDLQTHNKRHQEVKRWLCLDCIKRDIDFYKLFIKTKKIFPQIGKKLKALPGKS